LIIDNHAQVNGFPHGYEYVLDYPGSLTKNKVVDFDGFKIQKVDNIDFGVFIETKGSGYEKLSRYEFWRYIELTMVKQAIRQVEAIIQSGTHIDTAKVKPLEWHFAERYALETFRVAIETKRLDNGDYLKDYIKLIYLPE
jgi:hypothetical protein